MIRPLQRAALLCVFLLSTAFAAFAAPVELDPPSLDTGTESSATIHLDVVAGASGAPNGFTVEWMTQAQFDAIGDWPADPLDPRIQFAIFLGLPSLNTVDGTYTFLLGPGQTAKIEIGDIFDETGVLSDHRAEMAEGTDYVFRVKANGDGGDPHGGGTGLLPTSPYSSTQHAHTSAPVPGNDCVKTIGYWKNHPSAWPVSSLKLGNIIYSKAQLLLILNQPAAGNGLISLAHQLIASKLNVIAGAIPSSSIQGAIATADALIGNKIVPPIGSGYLTPATASHLTDDLEEFNNEETSTAPCQGTTPTQPRTWGELKAIYR